LKFCIFNTAIVRRNYFARDKETALFIGSDTSRKTVSGKTNQRGYIIRRDLFNLFPVKPTSWKRFGNRIINK